MNDLQVLLDWLTPFAWLLTSIIMLLGGCLLFTRQVTSLRWAQALLLVSAAGSALEAILVALTTWAEFRYPTSSTGGLIVFVTAPMFMMATLWTAGLAITAVVLGRYLRQI
jgi:hypothetical protein